MAHAVPTPTLWPQLAAVIVLGYLGPLFIAVPAILLSLHFHGYIPAVVPVALIALAVIVTADARHPRTGR